MFFKKNIEKDLDFIRSKLDVEIYSTFFLLLQDNEDGVLREIYFKDPESSSEASFCLYFFMPRNSRKTLGGIKEVGSAFISREIDLSNDKLIIEFGEQFNSFLRKIKYKLEYFQKTYSQEYLPRMDLPIEDSKKYINEKEELWFNNELMMLKDKKRFLSNKFNERKRIGFEFQAKKGSDFKSIIFADLDPLSKDRGKILYEGTFCSDVTIISRTSKSKDQNPLSSKSFFISKKEDVLNLFLSFSFELMNL